MRERDEREAVLWCGLLRPILFGEKPPGQGLPFLRELTEQEVTFPDGRKRKPSLSTLKRKLRLYQHIEPAGATHLKLGLVQDAPDFGQKRHAEKGKTERHWAHGKGRCAR